MAPRANSRLNLIARHLDAKPFLELNTPFSTERSAQLEDDEGKSAASKQKPQPTKSIAPDAPQKMSSQPPHPALLIPGPIEFDDAVLQAMSHYRYAQPLSAIER